MVGYMYLTCFLRQHHFRKNITIQSQKYRVELNTIYNAELHIPARVTSRHVQVRVEAQTSSVKFNKCSDKVQYVSLLKYINRIS